MGIIAAKRLLWKYIEKKKGTNKESVKESSKIGKSSGFLGLKMILYGSQKKGTAAAAL